IGGCLAVYAAFAVVFHSFIEPAVKTQAVAPYEPSARTAQPSATAFAVRSEPAPRVTTKQRTSPTITTTPTAPETTASVRSQASRRQRPPHRSRPQTHSRRPNRPSPPRPRRRKPPRRRTRPFDATAPRERSGTPGSFSPRVRLAAHRSSRLIQSDCRV